MRNYHPLASIMSFFVVALPSVTLADNHADTTHGGPAMNFHRIDTRLATGGHLTEGGLEELQESGVKVIIDLRDKPPRGHAERLAEHGIRWINVPVVWKDPRPADFKTFVAAMTAHADAHVLVQCQANYRASAMTYMYRVNIAGDAPEDAAKDLHAIWTPNEQWQAFIDNAVADSQ